jgi:hypothetical protein
MNCGLHSNCPSEPKAYGAFTSLAKFLSKLAAPEKIFRAMKPGVRGKKYSSTLALNFFRRAIPPPAPVVFHS